MNAQRFSIIDPATDSLFVVDNDTGLLLIVEGPLAELTRRNELDAETIAKLEAELEIELARRSEKMFKRIADKVENALLGRPRTTGDDFRLAEEVKELEAKSMPHRQAVKEVAIVLQRKTRMAHLKSATERVYAAVKAERQRAGQ